MKKIKYLIILLPLFLSLCSCAENHNTQVQEGTMDAPIKTEIPVKDDADLVTETQENVATEAADSLTPEQANEIARSLLANDALVERYLSKCQYLVDSDRAITFTEDGMDWIFAPVADSRCPFMSVDDIKIFLNDNYTRRFYENSVYVYIIGADGYSVNYIDYEGVLYQNITGGGGGSTEWAYETLTVSEITDTSFYAECGGMTLYDEAVTAKITIVLDEGLWKIDSFKTE